MISREIACKQTYGGQLRNHKQRRKAGNVSSTDIFIGYFRQNAFLHQKVKTK